MTAPTRVQAAAEALALAWCSRPVDGKPCEVCQPRAAHVVDDLARHGMATIPDDTLQGIRLAARQWAVADQVDGATAGDRVYAAAGRHLLELLGEAS